MRQHQSDATVQENACWILLRECEDCREQFEKTAAQEGCVKAVITAVTIHNDNDAVVLAGLWALHALACMKMCMKQLMKTNAIQLVLKAMKKFPKHDDLQIAGCCFFAAFVSWSGMRELLINRR